MLYKFISTTILLLALASGIASTPSLAPRIVDFAWRGSPTFVATERVGWVERKCSVQSWLGGISVIRPLYFVFGTYPLHAFPVCQ
ncbi:hypothetical protein FB451DRAFT_1212955 [Mycena latifolia]|nr:hypothetical protein FB451DRAFT_1212955 [Mycena latifolia]